MAYTCTWANMGLSMINTKANTSKNVNDSMFFVPIQMDGPLDAEKKDPNTVWDKALTMMMIVKLLNF